MFVFKCASSLIFCSCVGIVFCAEDFPFSAIPRENRVTTVDEKAESSGLSDERRPLEDDDGNDKSIRRKRSPEEVTNSSAKNLDSKFAHLSEEFLECMHVQLDPEDYHRFRNGTVYIPVYDKMYDTSNYLIVDDMLYICPVLFIDEILQKENKQRK